jgi:hypothetical protein
MQTMQNHYIQCMHKMHKEDKNVGKEEIMNHFCGEGCICEEGGGVQQLKMIEDKRCIEWE